MTEPGEDTRLPFDEWSRAIGEHFAGLRLLHAERAPARLSLRGLGHYGRVVRVSGGHQVLERKPGNDAMAASFKVLVQLRGSAQLCSRGDTLQLEGGQFALLDGRDAFTLRSDDGFDQLVFQLNRDWFESRLPRVGRLTHRMSGRGPGDSLCVEWLRLLADALADLPAGTDAESAEALLSALQLSDVLHAAGEGSAPSLVARAQRVIEARYHDADFGVEALTRQLRVSRRTLEKAFASIGTTPRRALFDARLEGAARELRRPSTSDATLLELALRHGFVSASHFSRRFSARFGVSPSAFRSRSFR